MRPGHVIGDRFAIDEWVSAGGSATVYRGHELGSNQEIAIKLITPRNPGDLDRFQREVKHLAELKHPRIVRYHAHGTLPTGELWLAMEWLEGETLADRLKRGPLSVSETVLLGRLVADALQVAHAKGILHRDVKPANLFLRLGRVGEVTLLDFGIARPQAPGHGQANVTQAGVVLGTPGYMAPEQARAVQQLRPAADVFALGCVLWECLAGEPCFIAGDVLAIVAKILLAEVPPISTRRPEVPPVLDRLIARMLIKEPTQRPADAAEVAALLDEIPIERAAPPPELPDVLSQLSEPGGLSMEERRLLSVVAVGVEAAPAPGIASRVVESFGGRWQEARGGATAYAVLSGGAAASDQVALAARCALALAQHVRGAAMGLATGQGVLGKHQATGEALDRAAELARRRGGGIRLDATTAGLLPARFDLEQGGGGAARLVGESPDRREPRLVLGHTPPLVGRDRELDLLRGAWRETVRERRARAVLIEGPPGIGKSRLAWTLVDELAQAGEEPWIGEGDALQVATPYFTIGRALASAAGIASDAPPPIKQRKLRAMIGRYLEGADIARVNEFLSDLLGMAGNDSQSMRAARRDPEMLASQLRRSFEDLLDARCRRGPVLLVLEDLHDADTASIELLDPLLRHLADRPFFLLGVARPELRARVPNLLAMHAAATLELEPLPARASVELVQRVLGNETPQRAIDRMVEQAGGSPYALEELVSSHSRGDGPGLPPTVVATLQARIEALPPDVRRTLRAASVYGATFCRAGLVPLVGSPEDAIARHLRELERRELISRRPEGRLKNQVEADFRVPGLRDVAYGTLSESDKKVGHRLAGEWLARAGEPDARVLADHFDAAGEGGRAAQFFVDAAEQALVNGDLALALSHAEGAIAANVEGPERGRARLVQAEAHGWTGAAAISQAHALEAMQLLPNASEAWYAAVSEAANASGQLADRRMLVGMVEELQGIAPTEEQLPWHLSALARCLHRLLLAGVFDIAETLIAYIEKVEPMLPADQPAILGWVHQARAWWTAYQGDAGASVAHHESALACAEQEDDVRLACVRRIDLGHAFVVIGQHERALEILRSAEADALRLGLMAARAAAAPGIAWSLACLGRIPEALDLLARADVGLVEHAEPRVVAQVTRTLARIQLMAGALDAAGRAARRAVEATTGLPTAGAAAHAVLARTHLANRRPNDALLAARKAMDLLDVLVEDGEGLVRVTWAEALDAAGKRAQAITAILFARDRLFARAERMGVAGWRRTFLEKVPEHVSTAELARAWNEESDTRRAAAGEDVSTTGSGPPPDNTTGGEEQTGAAPARDPAQRATRRPRKRRNPNTATPRPEAKWLDEEQVQTRPESRDVRPRAADGDATASSTALREVSEHTKTRDVVAESLDPDESTGAIAPRDADDATRLRSAARPAPRHPEDDVDGTRTRTRAAVPDDDDD